jgi:hypothetical protein
MDAFRRGKCDEMDGHASRFIILNIGENGD